MLEIAESYSGVHPKRSEWVNVLNEDLQRTNQLLIDGIPVAEYGEKDNGKPFYEAGESSSLPVDKLSVHMRNSNASVSEIRSSLTAIALCQWQV